MTRLPRDQEITATGEYFARIGPRQDAKRIIAYLARERECGSSAPDGYGNGSGAAGGQSGGNGGISDPTHRAATIMIPEKDKKLPPADPYTAGSARAATKFIAALVLYRQAQDELHRMDNLRSTDELDNDRQCHWLGSAAYGQAHSRIDGHYASQAVWRFHKDYKRVPSKEECAEFIRTGKWPKIHETKVTR